MAKPLKFVAYTILFIFVFAVSLIFNSLRTLGITDSTGFSLQSSGEEIADVPFKTETIDIEYITKEGKLDTRPIILYKPQNVEGVIPLIYVPHYAVEKTSGEFKSYLKNGWAVASPYDFKLSYNEVLVSDGLVFNNAALYSLRNRSDINNQQIAIVGGSAGGYTALMLTQLQMGVTATIANSPITNVFFNFGHFFLQCDSINNNSGFFEFPIPIQGMVSKFFTPNNKYCGKPEDPLWEAISPLSLAKSFSNPTIINHNTGDILVPVDQISKRYTYDKNDGTLPENFNARLSDNFPGILNRSLEEESDANQLSIQKHVFKDNAVHGNMPYSERLLTINIVDDGPISGKSGHAAPGATGSFNGIPFLKKMLTMTLKETEQLVPEKLMLLLDRYQGKSKQLPAHVGINDAVYGSLAIYQKEVISELKMYKNNHSLEELDKDVMSAIAKLSNDKSKSNGYLKTWNNIKSKL